jgi:hypothetical protein
MIRCQKVIKMKINSTHIQSRHNIVIIEQIQNEESILEDQSDWYTKKQTTSIQYIKQSTRREKVDN